MPGPRQRRKGHVTKTALSVARHQTRRALDERVERGVPERRIHAIAQDVDPGALPQATGCRKRDVRFCLEWFNWNTGLVLFMRALIVFIASRVTGSVLWAALSAGQSIHSESEGDEQ